MNIEYTKTGDYLLPNLAIKKQDYKQINKYGYLRLDYIKNHKKGLYVSLIMKNELTNHLLSVSIEGSKRYKVLMDNYIKSDEKLSEKSKETNQIEWAKIMNNYKNTAEEIILNELIYTENVWVRTHILCLASTEFVLPYKFYMGIPIPLMFRKEILNYENKK